MMVSVASIALAGPSIALFPQMRAGDIRPTQAVLGYLEVERKQEKIEDFGSRERNEYFQRNPVSVVIGPNGRVYAIDGHHFLRAVVEARGASEDVYVRVVANYSRFSKPVFWARMIERGFVYLFDENGEPIAVEDLPKDIRDLKDDPFRSLAGAVRAAGGFIKSQIPFSEFVWANFFRTRLKFKNSRHGLERVLPEAMDLAFNAETANLPGHISRHNACMALF